jgi:hypothetical protein
MDQFRNVAGSNGGPARIKSYQIGPFGSFPVYTEERAWPGPTRLVRFVPVAAIEDDGTILYSILTCSLPDASPKVYPG